MKCHLKITSGFICRRCNEQETFNFYKIATSTMRSASFQSQKWTSNDKDLEDKINKLEVNNKCNPVTENDLPFVQMEVGNIFRQNEPEYRKVLGITWNKNNDKFVFDFSNLIEIANEINPTKRNILKLIGICFDPLGLISPMVFSIEIVI